MSGLTFGLLCAGAAIMLAAGAMPDRKDGRELEGDPKFFLMLGGLVLVLTAIFVRP